MRRGEERGVAGMVQAPPRLISKERRPAELKFIYFFRRYFCLLYLHKMNNCYKTFRKNKTYFLEVFVDDVVMARILSDCMKAKISGLPWNAEDLGSDCCTQNTVIEYVHSGSSLSA